MDLYLILFFNYGRLNIYFGSKRSASENRFMPVYFTYFYIVQQLVFILG